MISTNALLYAPHPHPPRTRTRPRCPGELTRGSTQVMTAERRGAHGSSLHRRAPCPFTRTPRCTQRKDPRLSGSGTPSGLPGQRADRPSAHESTEGVLAATSTRRRAQMRNQKRQLKHGQSTKRMSITSLPALIGRSHESAR